VAGFERDRRSLCAKRRHRGRVPRRRCRADRPRIRRGRIHAPRDRMGAPAVQTLLRTACRVHAPDPIRQTGHGHVRSRARRNDARGAHGRHPRSHGRSRKRARRSDGRVRGRAALAPLRRSPPGPNGGAHPARCRGARAEGRGLAVGRGDGGRIRVLDEVDSGTLGEGPRSRGVCAERRRRRVGQGLARAAPDELADTVRVGGIRADGIRHRRSPRRSVDQPADSDRPRRRRPDLPRRERALPRTETSPALATSSCPVEITCRGSTRIRPSPRSASS
jgi:hypothetical protein